MISRVEGLMTPRIVGVSPTTRVADAQAVAVASRCRHLLVLDRGNLVGVTCVCELRRSTPDEPVNVRMRAAITIRPGDAPEDAAAVLRSFRIGCLPVVRRGFVIGVLSRGDLVRAGMDPELAGRATCASCRYPHNLREDPRAPGVSFCSFCRERSTPPDESEDLGAGG